MPAFPVSSEAVEIPAMFSAVFSLLGQARYPALEPRTFALTNAIELALIGMDCPEWDSNPHGLSARGF